MTPNIRAALYTIGGSLGYISSDSIFKAIADDMPLAQLLTLRGIIICVFLYALARRLAGPMPVMRGRVRGMVVARSLCEVGLVLSFLTALTLVPIAALSAILQTTPLVLTLAAYFILGEAFGRFRAAAICVGFIGVLMIIRPWGAGFTPAYGLGVLAVLLIVARDLLSRRIPGEVKSLWVGFWSSVAVLVTGIAMSLVLGGWVAVDARLAFGVLGTALTLALGIVFQISAMRTGSVDFIAPFRYSGLVFAIIFGIVFFDEIPDAWMLGGAALIVAAGGVTFWRERR